MFTRNEQVTWEYIARASCFLIWLIKTPRCRCWGFGVLWPRSSGFLQTRVHCFSDFLLFLGLRAYPSPNPLLFIRSKMTSADDNFGQTSTNSPNTNAISVPNATQPNNNYHRRNPANSTQPYANPTGMELRLLMTFRDAGAVIGTFHSEPRRFHSSRLWFQVKGDQRFRNFVRIFLEQLFKSLIAPHLNVS